MDVGSLTLGTLFGGAIGWLISRYFFLEATEDLRRRLDDQRRQLERQDTMEHFEDLVTNGTWHSESINHQTVWICDQKASFKIVEGDEMEPFQEEWTQRYPDPNTTKRTIELRINDSIVKTLTFINLDGFRILVPMPKVLAVDGKPLYFWEKDSLEYKVGLIIGDYYIWKNIEGVARQSGVEIVTARST
jgi:hypothetical protein